MSRYEKYKPSGIEWIGEVPEHWEVKRLKNLAGNVSGKSLEITDDDFLVALENIESNSGKFIESSTEYENNGVPFKKSHLLYNKLRPYLNKVYLAEKDGICVGDIIVVECSKKLQSKFLHYKMLSDGFCSAVMSSVQGTKMPRTSWEFISNLKFGIPAPIEQLAIANYLDDQTQKIDRLIANKKAQAEKLKELRQIEINNAVTKGLNPNAEMKDSGIEWLGEIPKYWEVKHLKRAFKFFNNIRIPLSSEERADLENIYDYYGASGVIDKVDRYLFDGDYILIGEDGANLVFRSTPLAFKASGKFWVNNHAHILQPIKGDIDYNTFLLEGLDYSIYISGSAQPKLTIEALSSMRVIVPPQNEQTEIANYLQKRTIAIDQLIKNIEAQIEKLQELRKIKIYEAVTGKIKVNAYAEPTA